MSRASAGGSGAFGHLLNEYRAARRLSQMTLGLNAEVSARHISFLETGRARPSRDMIHRLAQALGLTAAQQDTFLLAAGLAPEGSAQRADAIACAIHVQQAASLDVALATAQAGLARLGLRHVFTGVIVPFAEGSEPVIAHGDMSYAPGGWIGRYRERGYRGRDPFVRAASAARGPFFWSDVVRPEVRPTPCVRRILGEAAEFGITGGFVLPVRMADGRVLALSSMGSDIDETDPRLRWEARLLATALLDRSAEALPA